MAMKESGNRRHKWLATPLMLTLMAGISSIALAQEERSESLATTDAVNIGADHHRISSPIVGTWVFDIYDVRTGVTFHSLISFTDGGVLITNADFPTPSPFYGSWQEAKHDSYNASFYGFTSDANGVAVGLGKVGLTMKLTSPNTLTGTAVAPNCDLQGENCTGGDDIAFRFTGKRVPK
jgi:hypothetical protein